MTVQDTSLYNVGANGISYFTPGQVPASGSIDASEETVPLLFQSLKVRSLELQNRVMVRIQVDMQPCPWSIANIQVL